MKCGAIFRNRKDTGPSGVRDADEEADDSVIQHFKEDTDKVDVISICVSSYRARDGGIAEASPVIQKDCRGTLHNGRTEGTQKGCHEVP